MEVTVRVRVSSTAKTSRTAKTVMMVPVKDRGRDRDRERGQETAGIIKREMMAKDKVVADWAASVEGEGQGRETTATGMIKVGRRKATPRT